MKRTKITRRQRDLLEHVLQGKRADSFFENQNTARYKWNQWANDPAFREALANTVDRKEMAEVLDAVTLNRTAYTRLMTACPIENQVETKRSDEWRVRIALTIIEAMAKRLAELKPHLQAVRRVSGDTSPDLFGPTPEEYKALAEHLDRLRHEKQKD